MSANAPTTEFRQRAQPWLLLFGVWLVYLCFGLIMVSLAPLVDQLMTDLDFGPVAMGSILGIWQLVYIGAAIPSGVLLDRFPSRYTLTAGALLITLSAVGRSMAADYWTLLAAVMLFGIGGPIISAGAPKLIARYFTGSQRGLAMGIYMTGPALGGILALTATHSVLLPLFDGDWRSVLKLWALLTGISAVLWYLLALRFDQDDLVQSPGNEVRTAPSSARTLLKDPAVRLVMLMSIAVFLINHGFNNWLPKLLSERGLELTAAGYWAAFPTFIGILGSLLIPRLATPERRLPILAALAIAAMGACLLLTYAAPSAMVLALLLQGLARSSLMTVLILTMVELPRIGERNAGSASGLFFAAAEVGGVLGPLSLGLLYDLTGNFNAGLYLLSATACALLFGLRLLSLKLGAQPAAGPGSYPG